MKSTLFTTEVSTPSRVRSSLSRSGIAAVVAALCALFISTQPLQASTMTTNSGDQNATAQSGCGVRVYMTASGTTSADTTNDLAVKASLENGTSLCITIGAQYYNLSTVSANVTTSNYDVIYLQGQNNWGTSDRNNFTSTDLQVLDDFITAGGGLVVGEWHAWNACASSSSPTWVALEALLPATIKAGCQYESNVKVRFYRWDRPLSALVDTGVSSDFIFEPADYAGSLSELTLKTGATGYYYALWNSNVNQIPSAVSPDQLPSNGGVGMAGWVPAGKTGRVFSFSTTNGAPELTNTTSTNSFRRLLINSLGWSGSVGGSINPDTVAVATQAGGSISTPPFVPTKITGNITYSIVNGTLPAGLTLNQSNGQITGTPTQHGDINITIQAVGSSSGQAQALITLKIAANGSSTPATSGSPVVSATTTTTIATPTPAPTPTTTIAVSLPTPTTTVPRAVSKSSSLPTTGNSQSTYMVLTSFALMASGLIFRRLRRSQ